MTKTKSPEKAALASLLDCKQREIEETEDIYYGLPIYRIGSRDYAVGTEISAYQACFDYIRESVWAFNANFIIEHSKLPSEADEMVKFFQEKKCESANDTILTLIDDFPVFVEDAIAADGRGHFLSPYDGKENRAGEYLIYRVS